ncbi:MAG: YeeE/YedE thiosulfate transporter family protein [Verrucomicrobiota bacterium]
MPAAWLFGLLGGILIGVASVIAFAATGKIPGISGVFGRLFAPETQDRPWRIIFLAGLVAGAGITFILSSHAAEFQKGGRSLIFFAMAGVLVGLGTRIGGGCTSGHGVCGVGQGSKDSIAATITFVFFGMLTVWVMKQFAIFA